MFYNKPLKTYQLNYLCIMRLIPIEDICFKILKMKNKYEKIETFNYHYNMWSNIAGRYHHCIDIDYEKTRMIYSYIFNKNYECEKDLNMDFFNYTGISYQVRCLLLRLIINIRNNEINKIDKQYSKMAVKIMDKNKTNILFH